METDPLVGDVVRLKAERSAWRRRVGSYEYLEIDRKRVYRSLGTELKDFEAFVRAVGKLL